MTTTSQSTKRKPWLLDEHFHIKGREKWYDSVDENQAHLDTFIEFYNVKRSHQGYRLNGRTLVQVSVPTDIVRTPTLKPDNLRRI